MGSGKLSELQICVLEVLAGIEPEWTLAGGGALVGFHLHHRTTRDLDLFWRGRGGLDPQLRHEVDRRLRSVGLESEVVQVTPTLLRLRVISADETLVLDLLADPSPALEEPGEEVLGESRVRVDGPHEILVDKLCALLGRSELRDLLDVQGILESGGDLARALADAPERDSGFSPLTLAWVLRGMPLTEMAAAVGWTEKQMRGLDRFRENLVDRLTRAADPDAEHEA